MKDKLHKVIDHLADDLSRQHSAQQTRWAKFSLILLTIGVIGSSIRSLLSGDVGSLVVLILIGVGVLLIILSQLLVRKQRTVAVTLYMLGLTSAIVSALLVLFSFT